MPDVDGALRALEYALDVLKLDGVVLFSNARGIYLGDPRFRPLFGELERRAAVVFVHPTSSPDSAVRGLGLPDTLIDFTADATRAVAQLHYGNIFARTPNVKYIFVHAGGTIPYLATRFSMVDDMNTIPSREKTRYRGGYAALTLLGHGAVMAASHSADASLRSRLGPGTVRLRLSVSATGSRSRLSP